MRRKGRDCCYIGSVVCIGFGFGMMLFPAYDPHNTMPGFVYRIALSWGIILGFLAGLSTVGIGKVPGARVFVFLIGLGELYLVLGTSSGVRLLTVSGGIGATLLLFGSAFSYFAPTSHNTDVFPNDTTQE